MISSPALIKALIDKKSAIYSSRPPSYVSHDLITRGEHILVMAHSDKWRLFRKLVHQQFHEAKCEKEHVPLQNAEAVQMLNDFCVMPEQMMNHPKRFSNSIIMSLRECLPKLKGDSVGVVANSPTLQSTGSAAQHPRPRIWLSYMNSWNSGPK